MLSNMANIFWDTVSMLEGWVKFGGPQEMAGASQPKSTYFKM